jgi:hypothetical protein
LKSSRLLSLSASLVGGLAAARVLTRRQQWEHTHNRVAICVDYDDVHAAALRAGMPFDDLLHELAHHGATHLSLPELTLNRLLALGALTPQAPAKPHTTPPQVGHWNYLYGPTELVTFLAVELAARLPYTEAYRLGDTILAFAGDLRTLGDIGLGFDWLEAHRILSQGLHLIPRPVSYAWPEKALLERTLAHAAKLGSIVAFDGDMILGHEMHLGETLAALEKENLTFAYFAESRHQKGDWFIAKRRAPRVVLAHRFTPQEMVPLDLHAASHHWAHLARERGIRLCVINFFKVLHATEPLEGLHYVEHIKEALEHEGFIVTPNIGLPTPVPAPSKDDLALTGLASAGVAAAATTSALNLPEALALPLTAVAVGGAAALPYLEKPRTHLEEQYPPSYAPKALALAASLAPALNHPASAGEWAANTLTQASAAASLAAATSGQDYHLRIEDYRGLNLDWAVPLAAWALKIPSRGWRTGALAAISGAWYFAWRRNRDPLATVDPAHAEGHTHHLSAAAQLTGDALIALGPKPARKWAGLGPFASALSVVFRSAGKSDWAVGASLLGTVGHMLGLVGFRRSERAIVLTAKDAAKSFGLGAVLGLVALLFMRRGKKTD